MCVYPSSTRGVFNVIFYVVPISIYLRFIYIHYILFCTFYLKKVDSTESAQFQ